VEMKLVRQWETNGSLSQPPDKRQSPGEKKKAAA
jgi:hypothetical protein